MIKFLLNDRIVTTSSRDDSRVLDLIRGELNLKGTKEGCREGDCGACLVLLGELNENRIDYKPVNSCLLPINNIQGKHLITIEGIKLEGLNLVQKSFVEENAIQCGFCTPGFILSLTGYLLNSTKFNYENALRSIDGNTCRCTGYNSIKRAVDRFIRELKLKDFTKLSHNKRFSELVNLKILPEYFLDVKSKLAEIKPQISMDQTHSAEGIKVFGGTDLYVQNPDGFEQKNIQFINSDNHQKIHIKGEYCYIDARTTIEEIYQSQILKELLPEIKKTFHLVASTPIRNRATIGGNIVNASPIGDLSIFFLPLKSDLLIHNGGDDRILPLNEIFLDYKDLDLKSDEIIEWIRFPLPGNYKKMSFEKVSKRIHLDIASVNSAMVIESIDNKIIDIEISAGGVAPIPKLLTLNIDDYVNQSVSILLIKDLADKCISQITPIDDARGSAEYKSLLLRQLIFSHFIKIFADQFDLEEFL